MFILSGFSLLLVLFFSSCVKPSSPSSISDQTVMLHWLDLDEEGIVRLANADGNFSRPTKIFSGKAIETFEQSPTKSVSGWKDGKRHGETIEYFYNGRKRRVIRFAEGVREGEAEEYRITGELLRVETYSDNILNGPKKNGIPMGRKYFRSA